MTDICAGPPLRHGYGVEGGAGVDSAARGGVSIDAGVDAAAGDKSAAGPTSMTVCGVSVVELDADAGDSGDGTVASSAVGDVIFAGDGAAADDCAGDGCSAGENDATADGCAIGEACGIAESVAGDGDEAASAARNEESSAAEDGADGDDCAAGDGCIEADDRGDASATGVSVSSASTAIFGVASAEGMRGGDPAMAVDAASADAAFEVVLAEVVSAVGATVDMPAGTATPGLIANRLTTEAGLAASFAAVSGACNGAAAEAGIDDSFIADDACGRFSSGPHESRASGALSASAFIGISTMRACGASGTSTVCSLASSGISTVRARVASVASALPCC
jgi:hypothetical protein